MRYLFLICFFAAFSFLPKVDSALEISIGDGPSAYEPGHTSSDSSNINDPDGPPLQFHGFSGAIIRSLIAQNSQQPSYNNNGYRGYNYGYSQPPIYGNAGYTSGRVNGIRTINTGLVNNYGGYSTNYWNCVNNYRGQYYYSYTYNDYVCDTRANRNGK